MPHIRRLFTHTVLHAELLTVSAFQTEEMEGKINHWY